MKKTNFSILVCVLFISLFSIPFIGLAQPGNPGGDPDSPITGIEILLGAGGLLGIRKLINSRKQK